LKTTTHAEGGLLGLLNTSIVKAVLLSHWCGQNLYWEFCRSSTKKGSSVGTGVYREKEFYCELLSEYQHH